MQILAIDVGGTHVKILATGQTEKRKVESGPQMTAAAMVPAVLALADGWSYDVISMGYPGPVLHGAPVRDPANMGPGWVGFDFEAAFHHPVKLVNDAAMQALGSYQGGRMLFLGVGTGLGSAMIVDGLVEPMEMGHLPYKKGLTYEDFVGLRGLERLGKKRWRQEVAEVVEKLCTALEPDEVVLGGGNAELLKELPPRCRLGDNDNAFLGGFRLWEQTPASPVAPQVLPSGMPVLSAVEPQSPTSAPALLNQDELRAALLVCAQQAQATLDAAERALAQLDAPAAAPGALASTA